MSSSTFNQTTSITPSSSLLVNFQLDCSLSLLAKNGVDISKKKHSGPIYSLKFSSGNGQYCMSAGGDKTIKLLNPFKSFFVLKEYKGHGYEVFDLDM